MWDPVGGSPWLLLQLSVGLMPSDHLSSFLLSWELEAGQSLAQTLFDPNKCSFVSV